ncbi:hypothetical protein [Halomontanus rarus]|uniref:phage NrS-1 polymerase family protein n=1 Tax=Halomontanus rarus TaxID=3034020 RepID=UPI00293BBE51|nr:hypothetical protein [Halovivax sp. KZCA124]
MSSTASIDQTVLPVDLRERDQWVCWRQEQRDGKPTKIPVTPGTGAFASSTDPETWDSFETALEYTETVHADGVGFVFTDDDPIVGVDLDDCREPQTGDVNDAAQDIITRLDSYTEVSPSGTGYHVLIMGELPQGRNRRGSIELYDTARFFTVTGDHLEETPSRVARRQDALVAIHREYVQDTGTDAASESGHHGETDDQSAVNSTVDIDVDLEDEELLEKARSASNGEKFDRLWRGSTSGYESQSEADMALCCLLAFWTGGDAARMDQLFRQSGLIREKWDDVHYSDGSTYGEKTVERAIANTDDVYDPSSGEGTDQQEPRDETTSSEQTVGGTDGARAAYLAEKNQLLSERVSDLEATLEEKTERLEELEVDNQALREQLDACEDQLERLRQQCESEKKADTVDGQGSILGRAKRFVGGSDE